MTATIQQAQRYAQLKKTKVIKDAYRIDGDSIIFVVEAGGKFSMTGEELDKEIATMEKALAKEQAILAIDADSEPKPKKEQKPKKE